MRSASLLKYIAILSVFLLLLIYSSHLSAQHRKEYLLDQNWKFMRGEVKGAVMPGFNDKSWENISIPHDWAIEGPFDINNDI